LLRTAPVQNKLTEKIYNHRRVIFKKSRRVKAHILDIEQR
jgi:hypothetical protein